MTTIIKPQRPLANATQTAAQIEQAAAQLRCAARELEALAALPDIENVSYWEWKSRQEDARDRHQPFNALPMEFTHWLLLDEAAQLEARAREMRGGK